MVRRRLTFSNDDPYSCCCCLHVRTGTILLGIWHMMAQSMLLMCMLMNMMNPQPLDVGTAGDVNQTGVTNPPAELLSDGYLASSDVWKEKFHRKVSPENQALVMLLTLPYMVITYLLIHGAAKNKPQYLLPFFCIQVFDFVLSCLTMLGYFSSSIAVKEWLMEKDFPGKEQLLQVDTHYLVLCLIIIVSLALTIKAYFINVVWMCYKYLNDPRNQAIPPPVAQEYNNIECGIDSDAEVLLPPKYEDAIKIPKTQLVAMPPAPPPPPYAAH